MTTSELTFDHAAFTQALDVLGREEPSAKQQKLFDALNVAVWSALALTVVWIAAAFTPYQGLAFLVAAVSYGAVSVAFLANLPLLMQLRRAARAERHIGTFATLAQRRQRRRSARYSTALDVARHVIGYPLTALGLLGLTALQLRFDRFVLVFAVFLLTLGLACLFIYPMERGRRRLAMIAGLRRRLLQAREGTGVIDAATHDCFTCVESVQIHLERDDSVRQQSQGATPVVLFEDEFSSEVAGLTDEIASAVFDCVDDVIQNPSRFKTRGNVVQDIPETDLAIAFRYDPDANTIHLVELRRRPLSERL